MNARPHLEVADVERSTSFYERAFGFRVLHSMGDPPVHAGGFNVAAEPTDRPWGIRDLVVVDPDGHLIAFGERIG